MAGVPLSRTRATSRACDGLRRRPLPTSRSRLTKTPLRHSHGLPPLLRHPTHASNELLLDLALDLVDLGDDGVLDVLGFLDDLGLGFCRLRLDVGRGGGRERVELGVGSDLWWGRFEVQVFGSVAGSESV